jgi:hypothetical protein
LRRQGASRWAVARTGWQSYLVIVISGAVVGGIAAAVAWLATRASVATLALGLVAIGLAAALSGATRSVQGRSR